MCHRVLATVTIIISVVLYVIMALADDDIGGAHSKFITIIVKPFIVMSVVLATGALIKYLISDNSGCDCNDKHGDKSCSVKKNHHH